MSSDVPATDRIPSTSTPLPADDAFPRTHQRPLDVTIPSEAEIGRMHGHLRGALRGAKPHPVFATDSPLMDPGLPAWAGLYELRDPADNPWILFARPGGMGPLVVTDGGQVELLPDFTDAGWRLA